MLELAIVNGLEASLRAHLLRTLSATSVQWSLECQQRLDGIPEEVAEHLHCAAGR